MQCSVRKVTQYRTGISWAHVMAWRQLPINRFKISIQDYHQNDHKKECNKVTLLWNTSFSLVKANKDWCTWLQLATQGDMYWRIVIYNYVESVDPYRYPQNDSFSQEYQRNTVELLNTGTLSICYHRTCRRLDSSGHHGHKNLKASIFHIVYLMKWALLNTMLYC